MQVFYSTNIFFFWDSTPHPHAITDRKRGAYYKTAHEDVRTLDCIPHRLPNAAQISLISRRS